jgi:hypothetical protein
VRSESSMDISSLLLSVLVAIATIAVHYFESRAYSSSTMSRAVHLVQKGAGFIGCVVGLMTIGYLVRSGVVTGISLVGCGVVAASAVTEFWIWREHKPVISPGSILREARRARSESRSKRARSVR